MMKTSKLLLAAASLVLAASAASAEDDKIVIGGALSMTGIQAPLATPGYNGAQVAVKYLNDNGGVLGKQVEFINIDGKSDPVTVGNVAVELIDKGAQVIVAPCDFDFGSPAISITGSGKVMVSRTTGFDGSHRVSPVVVSFRPARAMMSPAKASSISSRLIACMTIIRPTRSRLPLVEFIIWSPFFSAPE